MKVNWRVLLAVVLVVGALVWMVDSLRPRSYSGANLRFGIGSGPVTVTNPSDEPVSVQLVGGGTRSYSVSSTIEGVSGSSTREGSGRNLTNVFSFMLPSGVSEFAVTRGTEVNFVASTESNLEATVQPLGASEARTTLIVGIVVVLGALFYISNTNGHRWISPSRRKAAAEQAARHFAEAQDFKRRIGSVSADKP